MAMLFASTSSLKAQFSNHQFTEITLSCHGSSLESALEKISQKAGVFFIYSSSLLDPNKTVSFAAQGQPLNKVLDKLGKELNLSFRYEGKYVIIKKSELIVRNPEVKIFSPVIASADVSSNPLIGQASQSGYFDYPGILLSVPKFSPIEIKTPQLTPLKPLEIIAPKGIMHKQWFISVGLIANGYTNGGAELRGGIKPLYGVINFGLVNSAHYRMGYGLGTAASLSDKLSFNLIYNFGQVLGPNDVVFIRENDHFLLEKNYTVSMKHNQMKVMLQYDLHPRFHVNAGASFNLLQTNYQLQNVFHSMNIISGSATEAKPGFGSYTSTNIYTVDQFISPARPIESSFQTIRTWVSWEVGVFYRINF